jgi:hypothetical protein
MLTQQLSMYVSAGVLSSFFYAVAADPRSRWAMGQLVQARRSNLMF